MILSISVSIKHAGMEEASCKKAAYVSDYLDNTDDITVIQGPAARVRPRRLPDEFFSCKQIDLSYHMFTTSLLFWVFLQLITLLQQLII